MEFFAAKGACSFGAHVVIRELGLPIPVTLVDLGKPGTLIHRINPLGRVPALALDDGSILTENSAILPYLADLRPGTPLFAEAGSIERARIQSWIGFVNSEVHAAAGRALSRPERYSADPAAHDAIRAAGQALLRQAFAPLERHLSDHEFLVGERFTIADAYFGLFAGHVGRIGGAPDEFPAITAYGDRYEARPSVRAARQVEELELAA